MKDRASITATNPLLRGEIPNRFMGFVVVEDNDIAPREAGKIVDGVHFVVNGNKMRMHSKAMDRIKLQFSINSRGF